MPSTTKEMMMKEITTEFEKSPYAFVTTFETLSVADLSEFRRQTEKSAKRSLLVKHTLAKKVFTSRNLHDAEKFLTGQVLVTFGQKDPQIISKAIVDFTKANNKLVAAGMIMDGKVYGQAFLKQLAGLPSRQELLTQVVIRVKSPVSGFVLTLGQIMKGFVVALNEVKKKKETQTA